jgi:hypothetical protein
MKGISFLLVFSFFLFLSFFFFFPHLSKTGRLAKEEEEEEDEEEEEEEVFLNFHGELRKEWNVLFGRHTQRKAEVKGNLLAELRV